MKTLGRHILVELYECDRETLNDTRKIRDVMVEAAKVARCTVIKDVFHKFSPHGVSGVVVVSESHLAIHTWPEFGYAAVDLFTCGDQGDPWLAYQFLAKGLKAGRISAMEMLRGAMPQESPVGLPSVNPVPVPAAMPVREERAREAVPALTRAPRLRVAAGLNA